MQIESLFIKPPLHTPPLHLPVPAGTSRGPAGNQLVPAGDQLVPAGTQLVPAVYQLGTSWQMVPAGDQLGTSWYKLVPSWYQLVLAGTSWVPAGTNWFPAGHRLVPAGAGRCKRGVMQTGFYAKGAPFIKPRLHNTLTPRLHPSKARSVPPWFLVSSFQLSVRVRGLLVGRRPVHPH